VTAILENAREKLFIKTRDENMKRITDYPSKGRHISLSQPQQAELRTDSVGEKLNIMISNLPTSGVSLAEIRDIVGQDGLLVLIAFLAIVFMVPVSIPGVSTVFGAAILMIGTSRLLGCTLWLPKCITQRVLPTEKLRTGLNQSSIWLHRLERLSRPHRLNWLTSTWLAEILNNCVLITASALLMAPFGLIPFSNTLPALALLFLAIGLLQHDGPCILFGHIANLCAFIYFISIIAGGSAAIRQALWHVMEKAS
jgi:hypothetical protein